MQSKVGVHLTTAQRGQSYRTKDGRELQLRLIEKDDATRLVDFFYALSSESRWRRFHISTDHLDQATVQAKAHAYAAVDNGQQEGAVVALYTDPQLTQRATSVAERSPLIVGVARLARINPSTAGACAEIAMVVRDDFQQQGVGQALLRQLVSLAKEMDITHLYADVQADNAPALRVLKKLGLPIRTETQHAYTATTILVE